MTAPSDIDSTSGRSRLAVQVPLERAASLISGDPPSSSVEWEGALIEGRERAVYNKRNVSKFNSTI